MNSSTNSVNNESFFQVAGAKSQQGNNDGERTSAAEFMPKRVNKFSGTKMKSVPTITKRKRTNYRLRKSIVPKCPLMVLNEMVGAVTYTFLENPGIKNGVNTQFTAQCTIDGQVFESSGASKQLAKNNCAELAIQSIVAQKCKDPKNYKTVDKDGNPIKHYQMEDETPWAQLSSFALFKLFNDWQTRGFDVPPELLRTPSETENKKMVPSEGDNATPTADDSKMDDEPVGKVKMMTMDKPQRPVGGSKKLPENPTERHPVQLLNEIQGGVTYTLVEEKATNPITFVMSAVINGITFKGEGKNKKDAKRNSALAALSEVYGIVYPNKE